MTKHSKNFDKYKEFYDDGRWNIKQLRNVTKAGAITAKEFKEITGEKYEPDPGA